MRVSLMIEGQEGVTWEQWLALARAAEDANLEGLFRSDHYRSIVRGDPAGSLDAWATLAGLAAVTTKLRLGTMVSPVTFRRVSVLAKLVTTVDHISSGRVELGIGAGWFESEHEAYGFTVECSIAYAYLPAAAADVGTPVEVEIFGEWVAGEVALEPLFDPKGERIRA